LKKAVLTEMFNKRLDMKFKLYTLYNLIQKQVQTTMKLKQVMY